MKKRFFLSVFLLVLALTAFTSLALADTELPPPDQISDNPLSSIVEWRPGILPFANELRLDNVIASIYKNSSTSVGIRATTEANKSCDLIGGQARIQQWKNNQWNFYHTTTYTAYDTDETTVFNSVTVESGYYYRLVLGCFAYWSDEVVTKTIQTKSILIN